MAQKPVSKRRAADILGCSVRTIHRYIQLGRLRSSYEGRQIRVFEDEVFELRKVQQGPQPGKMDMGMMLSRIQTLENQVTTCMRLLNVRYEDLGLTQPEYRTLYQMAQVYSEQGWPPHAEQQWADTFSRIKLEDLEKLVEAVEDPHPWKVFLRLASSMHINPYDPDLRGMFAAGRQSIQSVATIWCTLRGETPKAIQMLLENDANPSKKLMRHLAKTRS